MLAKKFPTDLRLLRLFSRNDSGAAAIEMTLVIVPFILLFLFIAELCSALYVSISIDLAMAEAMRYTASSSQDDGSLSEYKKTFLEKIKERITYLPLMIYKAENINFNVKYCSTLAQLASGSCDATVASLPQYTPDTKQPIYGTGTPIAYYTIEYKYTPLFLPIPNAIINPKIVRKSIHVMENTRIRKLAS